jgi:iron complex transport system ATP-binding protein
VLFINNGRYFLYGGKFLKALAVENLSFYYGPRLILDEITFSVSSGSICGLLGPNGSGKTTLLKCINGILKPARGCISVHNVSLKKMDRQEIAKNMSVVPQQTNTVFAFKVVDMVVMGRSPALEMWQKPTLTDRDDAAKVLTELGVGHLAERCFNEISGGERQMVLLARSIYQDTKIMLLDEPTSHLDLKNQIKIMDIVRSVAMERKITIIMTLHDPNLALHYCNDVVLLKEGCIMDMGEKAQVLFDDNLSSMYELKVSLEETLQGIKVILPECWREINNYQERGGLFYEKV